MKLYRDMTENERRRSDESWAYFLKMQKLRAEMRMDRWDNLTAEERKKYQEETNVCG